MKFKKNTEKKTTRCLYKSLAQQQKETLQQGATFIPCSELAWGISQGICNFPLLKNVIVTLLFIGLSRALKVYYTRGT